MNLNLPAYPMNQAQKHQTRDHSPRTVCSPKSSGPGEGVGQGGKEWQQYPKNVFVFCIQLPYSVTWVWTGHFWRAGGAIGNKTLNWIRISEIRFREGLSDSKGHNMDADMFCMRLRVYFLPPRSVRQQLQATARFIPSLPPPKGIVFILYFIN